MIIFIVSQGPFPSPQISGLARVSTDIAKSLIKDDQNEIYYFTFGYKENNKPIVTVPEVVNGITVIDSRLLLDYLVKFNPHILITVGENWMFNDLLKVHDRFPYTNWIHYVPLDSCYTPQTDINEFIKLVDILVVPTPNAQKVYTDHGIPAINIPHSVNIKDFYRYEDDKRLVVAKKLGINSNKFIVGYNGRFQERKNLLDLIFAWSKFINIVGEDNVNLVMLTNPDDSEGDFNLIEVVNKLEISNSVLISQGDDRITDNELNDFYNTLDIYISTSLAEGFNLPVLEALSTGVTPILTDNVPHVYLLSHLSEDIRSKFLIKSSKPFVTPVGTTWIKPDFNDIVDRFIYAYHHKDVLKQLITQNIEFARKHDINEIGQIWRNLTNNYLTISNEIFEELM